MKSTRRNATLLKDDVHIDAFHCNTIICISHGYMGDMGECDTRCIVQLSTMPICTENFVEGGYGTASSYLPNLDQGLSTIAIKISRYLE